MVLILYLYHSSYHLLVVLVVLQTANLDGETNLKIRKALEKTWDYVTPEKVSEFKGLVYFMFACIINKCGMEFIVLLQSIFVHLQVNCGFLCTYLMDAHFFKAGEIQCEQPNNSLYTFTGNMIINKQTLPLSPNQLLLRVCSPHPPLTLLVLSDSMFFPMYLVNKFQRILA